MAKKEAKVEGGGGGGGGLIGFIVATILALVCGGGFGVFLHGQMHAAEPVAKDKEPAQEAPKEPQKTLPPTAKLVALAPIVVNMAEPKDAWMRIEASILVDGMEMGEDALAAQVAEDVVAYLRTTSLSQFEGPSGFLNLREDLVDRATIRDREHIKDIVIHGVLVE